CGRNLPDGADSREDLPQVTRSKKAERYAAELGRRGVWRETADGWEIHDFLDYQPSKSQVQRNRAAAAERQRRWRDQHKHNGHGVSNGVTSSVTNAAPSRPVPTRSTQGGGLAHGGTPGAPEPPRQCADHIGDPDPPKCGACADARRRRDQWDADQARADAARRSAQARRRAELRQAEIDACHQCDDRGYLPTGRVCHHRPMSTTGAAAARAALTRKETP